KLPHCVDAKFFSFRKPYCLSNTGVELLQRIIRWSQNPRSQYIFWLDGKAGSGKSTVARTVARHLRDQNRLGAGFFFCRTQSDLRNSAKFITTVAVQLANNLPTLKNHICKAVAEIPDIAKRSLGEQWKYLIFRPLSRLKTATNQVKQKRLVVVIDALDECGNEDDQQLILRLISAHCTKSRSAVQLRFFVSSKSENSVRLIFQTVSEHVSVDDEPSQSILRRDIALFLHSEMEKIRREHMISETWPGKCVLDSIVKKARGSFVYAKTLCRFLRQRELNPMQSILRILPETNGVDPLDNLYAQVLQHYGKDRTGLDREKSLCRFRQIIGSIVVLSETLSVKSLTNLLKREALEVSQTLAELDSVLDMSNKGRIRLHHPSFGEFLLNPKRCQDLRFYINEELTHRYLFESCLWVMAKDLKRDMCNIRLPGSCASDISNTGIPEKHATFELQYACRYWIYHLQRGSFQLEDDGEVHFFLQRYFLYWLEVLSLMGLVSEVIVCLHNLQSILSVKLALHDHFVLNHSSVIEYTPLQIYCSGLVFTPINSITKTLFADQIASWIKCTKVDVEDWNPCFQVLKGHSEPVTDITFSPDGLLLASYSSGEKSIRSWNPLTGQLLGVLDYHSSSPSTARSFSSDCKLFASSSFEDEKIEVWDLSLGALHSVLNGHTEAINAVAFSPNNQLLASASNDWTIRLWKLSNREKTDVLIGHSGPVVGVAFSPNGRLLASASEDSTVRLWVPNTAVL
ncbi:hypothetical protein EDC01DRAFT_764815, partial [Geopyxis carbonaria]